MAGLEDADAADASPAKKPAKQPSRWSPARVIAMALPSPKKSATKRRNTPGKENSPLQRCSGNNNSSNINKTGDVNVDRVLRPYNSIDNSKLSRMSKRFSPVSARIVRKPGPPETGGGMSSSRRSLSPLFDPELLASIERELSEEGAHIKRMVGSEKPKHPKAAPPAMVAEGKCPPGGADAVVLYTTTLRGIRRTFEECNAVRAAIEAHDVKLIERDVSMDSGYREELRRRLRRRAVRVDGERKETVQCGECNENGLVRCPICS
uniref:Glutaredoxin domain-containing protein n=1 Tax=Oryza barthii TaxID=65489 RepID=A0A0D3FVM8_9ORYZ